jgi:hypothetical protein
MVVVLLQQHLAMLGSASHLSTNQKTPVPLTHLFEGLILELPLVLLFQHQQCPLLCMMLLEWRACHLAERGPAVATRRLRRGQIAGEGEERRGCEGGRGHCKFGAWCEEEE